MEAIVPYLTFNGNASEALDFYLRGAKITMELQDTFWEQSLEC
ncbi:MAG TPA: hypothetical protein VIJ95_15345 [Hanamia sp.]